MEMLQKLLSKIFPSFNKMDSSVDSDVCPNCGGNFETYKEKDEELTFIYFSECDCGYTPGDKL